MFRPIRRVIGAGTFAVLTVLSVLLASLAPKFWFSFYTDFSRRAVRVIGAVVNVLPFCVWQLVLVGGLVWLIVRLVHAAKHGRMLGYAAGVLELVCMLVFLFVGLWGLNHWAPTLAEQTGLEVRAYTKDELQKATVYYAAEAGQWADQVPRDEAGEVRLPEFSDLSKQAVAAYEKLGAENERFADPVGRVKPLLFSEAYAYMGTTGVFVCLTGEASVSTEAYTLTLPHAMCHELGHSLAVAREDEANYCAFLACRASDEPLFRYAGAYTAFVYCYNALFAQDKAAANAVLKNCSETLLRDCDLHAAHNEQYEGTVQDVAQAVNDTYLKTFQEEAGVQSYGLVVDYLIAAYLEEH